MVVKYINPTFTLIYVISDTQTFDGSVTENSLFNTYGIIEYLCFELVITMNFLLNLLHKLS